MLRFQSVGRALCTAVLVLPALQGQELSLEYQVKAAFLLNFARYADWPSQADRPLTVCLVGENPIQEEMAARLRGKEVRGRPVEARVVAREAQLQGCNLLYVPRDSGRAAAALIEAVKDDPVLTVGESKEFLAHGGSILFFLQDGKVRFRIDQRAVERTGIRISSRLMALSRELPEMPR